MQFILGYAVGLLTATAVVGMIGCSEDVSECRDPLEVRLTEAASRQGAPDDLDQTFRDRDRVLVLKRGHEQWGYVQCPEDCAGECVVVRGTGAPQSE